jgi:excisionase family DNA binding protein
MSTRRGHMAVDLLQAGMVGSGSWDARARSTAFAEGGNGALVGRVQGRAPAMTVNDLVGALPRLVNETRPEDRQRVLVALMAAAATLAAAPAEPRPAANGLPDENISTEEAARRLGLSRDWLYKHAAALPFAIRIGRRVLFSARGLERWNRQRMGA